MFNAERLLGKIIKETLGGKRKSSDFLDSLTSGSGLMTMVGLGVGAFEILSEQKVQKGNASHSNPVPPAIGSGSQPTAPPPLPKTMHAPPVPSAKSKKKARVNELALRLIQVMIAAAHADGILDESEEKVILDRLRGAELDSEEKMFLLHELHRPKPLAVLTSGINNPSMAKTMYMLAVSTVEVATETERKWLDELANQLGITSEVRNFIEEQGQMKN